jgi:hypothetical protein
MYYTKYFNGNIFFIIIIIHCFRYGHLLNSIKYYKIVYLNIIFISPLIKLTATILLKYC